MLRITLLSAAVFALPAFADTHISYVDDSGQPATQIYVKGGKVRMEGGQGRSVAIYDLASNSMTVLMPDRNQYLVMDEKSADQMGAQMSAAQAQAQAAMKAHQAEIDQAQKQMQAAMAQMTPEQRAQMQQMLGPQGAPGVAAVQAGAPQLEMQDLGSSETVAGHSCRDMQMVMNGRPISTLCVTDSLASFGIPAADARTLERMRDNMRKMDDKMGPMAQGMSAMMSKGFTLKSTHQTLDGFKRVTVTDSFKSVSTAGLAGSLFEIPAGYTQVTMAQMMDDGPHH